MNLSAQFDSRADRRAYGLVAAGAAALSYYHARAFFLPFMGPVGASVTPLMMDAVVFWLASANVRQAQAGRPLPMLRLGAYGLLALTVTANALGGAGLAERVFLALPAALFGFLVEARTRLALYQHRAAHGDDRLRVRLWLRHPVRTLAAWLWLARQSAPAFDRASAEQDRLRAARDAVRLALPGRSRAVRRARAGVLRELNAGRLPAVTAVTASGLLTRPGVPELHRAALAASLGADLAAAVPPDITAPAAASDGQRALSLLPAGPVCPWPQPAPVLPGARVRPAPGTAPDGAPAPGRTRTRGTAAARTASAPRTRAVTDEAAEVHFAADLAAGRVPSARRIKTGLHVGQDRAARIRDHLTAVVTAPREHSRRTA